MIDTSIDFMFLRPNWLWCLLPVLFLSLLRRRRFEVSQWHRYLPAAVIERLLKAPDAGKRTTRPWWPAQLLLMLMIVALAGPSFIKQAVPAVQKKDAVVVVLDLSLSMYAEDQSPSRLARAKQKIYDLLALRQDGLTGLVVFAGSAHVVAPLTDDRETLRAMLPALDPAIMPDPGANPGLGLLEASNLIRQAGLESGRILLLTDSIEAENLEALISLRTDLPQGVAVSVLSFGTESGGPISLPDQGFLKRGGEVIIARADLAAAKKLVSTQSVDRVAEARFDDSDLRRLVPELNAASAATQAADSDQTIEQRIDQGFWLLPLMAILGLIFHRRGALLAAIGPMLLVPGGLWLASSVLVLSSTDAAAEDTNDNPADTEAQVQPNMPSFWERLWQRQDQLADEAYQAGEFATAAALYSEAARRGAAQYQMKAFGAAAETLASAAPDPVTRFNQGNAHAYAGELELAIAAYDAALELDPDMNVARENRAMIEELLKQQQQQQKQQQQQQQKNQQDGEEDSEQEGGQGEQKPDGEPSEDGQGQDGGTQQDSSKGGKPGDQSASQDPGQQDNETEQTPAEGQQQADDQAGKDESKQAAAEQSGGDGEELPDAAAASAEASTYDLSEQQQEQWLRRIPDDPGELLQRKFLYQYRNPDSRYDQRAPGSGQDEAGAPATRTSPGTASSNPW
ncbi:VWA domain-containing protein [Allohahella marinimesophila]|uniref:VWA domain-containing protein n=1 Tax=Allohahella marinimesophila TaxID=1054972 RepID=A0ABP7QAI7_9GAMM